MAIDRTLTAPLTHEQTGRLAEDRFVEWIDRQHIDYVRIAHLVEDETVQR